MNGLKVNVNVPAQHDSDDDVDDDSSSGGDKDEDVYKTINSYQEMIISAMIIIIIFHEVKVIFLLFLLQISNVYPLYRETWLPAPHQPCGYTFYFFTNCQYHLDQTKELYRSADRAAN